MKAAYKNDQLKVKEALTKRKAEVLRQVNRLSRGDEESCGSLC